MNHVGNTKTDKNSCLDQNCLDQNWNTKTDKNTYPSLEPVRKMDPRPIYFGFWCLMSNTTKSD